MRKKITKLYLNPGDYICEPKVDSSDEFHILKILHINHSYYQALFITPENGFMKIKSGKTETLLQNFIRLIDLSDSSQIAEGINLGIPQKDINSIIRNNDNEAKYKTRNFSNELDEGFLNEDNIYLDVINKRLGNLEMSIDRLAEYLKINYEEKYKQDYLEEIQKAEENYDEEINNNEEKERAL